MDKMKILSAFLSAFLAPYVTTANIAISGMSLSGGGHGVMAASSSRNNCNCGSELDPLCGSDNMTYSNKCAFDCENERRKRYGLPDIRVIYKGACKQPICVCNSDIFPVCGTNSKTYRNICLLECVNEYNQALGRPGIGVRFFGVCPVENCICPLIRDPVCGTNKRTYTNRYMLDCENRRLDQLGQPRIKILHMGGCINCNCTGSYKPVCGSNEKTYRNFCKMDCENKQRALYGLAPLTGSNGECPDPCINKQLPLSSQ